MSQCKAFVDVGPTRWFCIRNEGHEDYHVPSVITWSDLVLVSDWIARTKPSPPPVLARSTRRKRKGTGAARNPKTARKVKPSPRAPGSDRP